MASRHDLAVSLSGGVKQCDEIPDHPARDADMQAATALTMCRTASKGRLRRRPKRHPLSVCTPHASGRVRVGSVGWDAIVDGASCTPSTANRKRRARTKAFLGGTPPETSN